VRGDVASAAGHEAMLNRADFLRDDARSVG
jgi:hypothetical protein